MRQSGKSESHGPERFGVMPISSLPEIDAPTTDSLIDKLTSMDRLVVVESDPIRHIASVYIHLLNEHGRLLLSKGRRPLYSYDECALRNEW